MQIGVEFTKAVDNKRIFVVVDDEIARTALQFMLHDDNETHEFGDADAALRKALDWPPDLVILGMDVVRIQGAALVTVLRDALPGAGILLVADDPDDACARQALAAGASGILALPLTVEAVRRKADAALGRRPAFVIPIHRA